MHVHALCNIHNELNIGIVVVVGTARYLDVVVGHPNVVRVGLQIFGCGHDGKLYRPLIAKCFVRPLTDGSDLFHSSNAVVGDQDLQSSQSVPCDHCRLLGPGVSIRKGTYISDNSVAAVLGDKVLHLGRRRVFQPVSTDIVLGKLVLLRVRGFAVGLRNNPVAIGSTVAVEFRHVCGMWWMNGSV